MKNKTMLQAYIDRPDYNNHNCKRFLINGHTSCIKNKK